MAGRHQLTRLAGGCGRRQERDQVRLNTIMSGAQYFLSIKFYKNRRALNTCKWFLPAVGKQNVKGLFVGFISSGSCPGHVVYYIQDCYVDQ
eukprot:365255-Chlamydomonas_euryale.AAC.24